MKVTAANREEEKKAKLRVKKILMLSDGRKSSLLNLNCASLSTIHYNYMEREKETAEASPLGLA